MKSAALSFVALFSFHSPLCVNDDKVLFARSRHCCVRQRVGEGRGKGAGDNKQTHAHTHTATHTSWAQRQPELKCVCWASSGSSSRASAAAPLVDIVAPVSSAQWLQIYYHYHLLRVRNIRTHTTAGSNQNYCQKLELKSTC